MARRYAESAVAGALGGAAALAACGVAGALLAGTALARLAVTPARRPEERVVIERIAQNDGPSVAWMRGPDVSLPGQYSLLFDGDKGHARLGDVRERSGGAVAREVLRVDRGQLRPGVRGRIAGWWFTSPEDLGFKSERISYQTELGLAEAWIVHPRFARKRRWAVHVHGRGARPEETLRGVAPLARAGITNIIISYRNDPGAPAGRHGRYGMGLSESRDVDAAIAEALNRGAERVTLFGWSMGATACLVSATRGEHAGIVDGLILDSPAIDWRGLLTHQAGGRRMPGPVAGIGIGLLGAGLVRGGEPGGLSFAALSPDTFAREIEVPVLIHAGERDTFVPCDAAVRLAQLQPDRVQVRLQSTGEHVKLWNAEPEAWERVTEVFARSLSRPAWRG